MVIKMVLMVFMSSLGILGIQVCFRGVLYFNKVLNIFSTQVLSLLVVAGSESGLTQWVLGHRFQTRVQGNKGPQNLNICVICYSSFH